MSLKETIQDVIAEHWHDIPRELVEREISIERIPGKATVITGIRRSGKTTLMRLREKELLENGVDRRAICFIDFSDDRLVELRECQPGVVADAYYSLCPEMENGKVWFFFDEIQNLRNWELLVNRLMNTRDCEVDITGSCRDILEEDVATVMGGRKLTWCLHPYSFREFLLSRNMESAYPHSAGERSLLSNAFHDYMETGGFPEAGRFSSPSMRTKFLQDTAADIVFRDVIWRYNIKKPAVIKVMMQLLAGGISCRMSLTKLTQRIAGMQYKVNRAEIAQFLSCFVNVHFIVLVPIRSMNINVINTNEKKLYLADHAFARALSPRKTSTGPVLENIVALHLLRLLGEDALAYYRTQSGYEVDFAVGPDDSVSLIQVSAYLDGEESPVREREIRALVEASKELDARSALIVTMEEKSEIETDGIAIHVLPAWEFLLFKTLF